MLKWLGKNRIAFPMKYRNRNLRRASVLIALLTLVTCSLSSYAQDKKVPENDYYKIITFPLPDGVVLECGGLEPLPDGKLAVSTRRGDIYFIDGAYEDPIDPAKLKFNKWATGLHEVLGLAYNAKD